jgi:hypothetical protein
MSITVKKLITELEKIENKFLEVEFYDAKTLKYFGINAILKPSSLKKVLITSYPKKDEEQINNEG